jgi:hypothetical protein
MTLRNFGHGSLAGGPIILQMGWPHDPAKLPERWPHDAANRHFLVSRRNGWIVRVTPTPLNSLLRHEEKHCETGLSQLDTVGVGGSKPLAPTRKAAENRGRQRSGPGGFSAFRSCTPPRGADGRAPARARGQFPG